MKRLTLQQIIDLVDGDLSIGQLPCTEASNRQNKTISPEICVTESHGSESHGSESHGTESHGTESNVTESYVTESYVTGADIIRDVTENQVTFADKIELAEKVEASPALAVVVSHKNVEEFSKLVSKTVIAVEKPAAAFGIIVAEFRPQPTKKDAIIASTSYIDPSAEIAADVTIDHSVTIDANVTIGPGATIHSGARIMQGVSIGANTEIFSNAVIYPNTQIGNHCRIHANAVLGCDGFGYESTGTEHKLGAQFGNVVIEDHVDIGSGTTIDRGAYGSTRIGAGTKIDNQVQIGHNCKIGKRNLLCSLVGIAGSCTTGDDVVMAGQVGIGDHIHIGDQAILGAKAGVMTDIPEKQVYVGSPATPAKQQLLIQATKNRLPEMRKKVIQLEKKLEQLNQLVANLTLDRTNADDTADSNLTNSDAA